MGGIKFFLLAMAMALTASASAQVKLTGNVPNVEIMNLQENLNQIWQHESETYLQGGLKLPPPEIGLFLFDREQEESAWAKWQKEWIVKNPSIWLDWTQISGLPTQELTKEWIDAHVDTIFPFPKTFLAFHYDGTNRIQMNPAQTWLRFYQNDPFGMKRETVGYGFYVASHEMLHYVFENNGVPGRLHHCLFVTQKNGHSLMGDMTEYLINAGISANLVRQVGLQSEEGMAPCSQLNETERAEVQRYRDRF